MDKNETFDLFESCEKARTDARKSGKNEEEAHEAAKVVWNAWAKNLFEKRTQRQKNKQWPTKIGDQGIEAPNVYVREWMNQAVVDFTDYQFNDEVVHFDGYIFPGKVLFNNKKLEAHFKQAKFHGDVHFEGTRFNGEARFEEAEFGGEAHFEGAQFGGEAHFEDAHFTKDAIFSNGKFYSVSKFNQAEFAKLVCFQGAEFSQEVCFLKAKFHGPAEFMRTTFKENAEFKEVEFLKSANFGDVIFSNGASFEGTIFECKDNTHDDNTSVFSFKSAKFSGAVSFFKSQLFEVDFTEAKFNGEIKFDEAILHIYSKFNKVCFSVATSFNKTNFHGDAKFNETQFNGSTNFKHAQFKSSAQFRKAVFSGETDFERVEFSGTGQFQETCFEGETSFIKAKFSSSAFFEDTHFSQAVDFQNSKFLGSAKFQGAKFLGTAEFRDTEFLRAAWFEDTSFSKTVSFYCATFKGLSTSFAKAQFVGVADFSAINVERAFDLGSASFGDVPNFNQAHFSEAPRLDNVTLAKSVKGVRVFFRSLFRKAAPDTVAKFRALRRIAVQGHDHDNERRFLKGEIRSRRHTLDKPWYPAFWFGLGYDVSSDFGGSIGRPLFVGVVTIFAFAYLYYWLVFSAFLPSAADENMWQAITFSLKNMASQLFSGTPSPCVSDGNIWQALWQALHLSLKNAVLLISWDGTTDMKSAAQCLESAKATYGNGYVLGINALQIAQKIVSALLLFLFLLAVRNKFRIR